MGRVANKVLCCVDDVLAHSFKRLKAPVMSGDGGGRRGVEAACERSDCTMCMYVYIYIYIYTHTHTLLF